MTAALHWLLLAQRVLACEWVDRRGRDGWCETHDDPWPCGRAQEAADMLAEELDQPTKEQKMGKTTDDEGGLVRCECGRAVPCRHCPTTPTPIDPADIRPGSRVGAGHVRPGDVLDITYRVTVTAVGDECDIETDDRQRKHNLHAFNATGHLVYRPDPDAEAVEAMAVAEGSISGTGIWQWRDFLTQLRKQGWDVVRRAES